MKRLEELKTTEAFRQILRCHIVIAVNMWHAVNRVVRRCPWLVIGLTVIASAAVAFTNIANARAERDHANKEMAAMMDSIATYQAIIENKVYLSK